MILKLRKIFWLLCVFLTVLIANLAYHFLSHHIKATFAYDGHYYLDTCAKLMEYMFAFLHGDFIGWPALAQEDFRNSMVRDGPVIAGIPALAFLWLKRSVTTTDWQLFIMLFSILQAVSACFVPRLVDG